MIVKIILCSSKLWFRESQQSTMWTSVIKFKRQNSGKKYSLLNGRNSVTINKNNGVNRVMVMM